MSAIQTSAQALFSKHYIGALATIDSDGAPRSTPLHVVSDGESVYWLSKPDKTHSQNIDRDSRVSMTLAASDAKDGLQGVYIRGRANHLTGDDQSAIYHMLETRVGSKNMPPNMELADAYQLEIGTCDEQKSTTNCWYFYS